MATRVINHIFQQTGQKCKKDSNVHKLWLFLIFTTIKNQYISICNIQISLVGSDDGKRDCVAGNQKTGQNPFGQAGDMVKQVMAWPSHLGH